MRGSLSPVALLAVAMPSGFSAAQDYTKGDTLDICDGFNTFLECLNHVAYPEKHDEWDAADYQEYGTASGLAKWRTSKERPECDTLQHSMQLAFPAGGKFWDRPAEVPTVGFYFASFRPEYDGLDGFTAKYTAISDSGQEKKIAYVVIRQNWDPLDYKTEDSKKYARFSPAYS